MGTIRSKSIIPDKPRAQPTFSDSALLGHEKLTTNQLHMSGRLDRRSDHFSDELTRNLNATIAVTSIRDQETNPSINHLNKPVPIGYHVRSAEIRKQKQTGNITG